MREDKWKKRETREPKQEQEGFLPENTVEGRNAVLEAFRAGKTIDKLFIQEKCQDGPIQSILREARKQDTIVKMVTKERLDQLSVTGRHQGALAYCAACAYSTVEAMLEAARQKGEDPFLILLDGMEDPHNLGAVIRTANQAGAHGVVIPKNRAAGLTAVVARTSAGALYYTPVAKVTNLGQTIEQLKKEGLWFVCADMDGQRMYDLDLKGPIGLVIGKEGEGVSRLVKEKCDLTAAIPMKGSVDSLNASVAAGVLAYEIVRQRIMG
jgi:23S rRNA (guanosine2251-2'-O)-methyltransferase